MPKSTDTFSLNPDFYIHAFDALPKALVVLDNECKLRYFNTEAARLFCLVPPNHLGLDFGKAIHCREAESNSKEPAHQLICSNCRFEKSVSAAMRTKGRQDKSSMVMRLNRNNGEVLRLIQFESAFFNSGNIDYIIIVFDDLTETGEKAVSLT